MPTEAEKARAAARAERPILPPPAPRDERPDGKALIRMAIALVALGVIAAIAAALAEGEYSYELHATIPSPYRLPLFAVSAGLVNLAVIVWAIGQVQKALWFLPGREDG